MSSTFAPTRNHVFHTATVLVVFYYIDFNHRAHCITASATTNRLVRKITGSTNAISALASVQVTQKYWMPSADHSKVGTADRLRTDLSSIAVDPRHNTSVESESEVASVDVKR